MYLNFFHKTFTFRKHFDTVLTEEIRTAKFWHEEFVIPKHLLTNLRHGPFDILGGGWDLCLGREIFFGQYRSKVIFFAGPSGRIIFFIIEIYKYRGFRDNFMLNSGFRDNNMLNAGFHNQQA